jgi:hypothetical protein
VVLVSTVPANTDPEIASATAPANIFKPLLACITESPNKETIARMPAVRSEPIELACETTTAVLRAYNRLRTSQGNVSSVNKFTRSERKLPSRIMAFQIAL